MKKIKFDEHKVLHLLQHILPTQSPLKDFVHHNTLHAFQSEPFHAALQKVAEHTGSNVYLELSEYRSLYKRGKIKDEILSDVIVKSKGKQQLEDWRQKLLSQEFNHEFNAIVGSLRQKWQSVHKINIDKAVHGKLFNIIAAYVDQGIAISKMPVIRSGGLLDTVRDIEKNSVISFFKTKRARQLLIETDCDLRQLLDFIVGDEALYEHYLVDQQFGHPGWSGMVSVLEQNPNSILSKRKVSLRDFIALELLLEMDTLDDRFGTGAWDLFSVGIQVDDIPTLFGDVSYSEFYDVYSLWQEAMEWSYYDEVLKGIETVAQGGLSMASSATSPLFQAIFCIDDRECSIRRYIEQMEARCETFGVAGFFNIECYFQPEHAQSYTKVCPAPVTPKYLIQEKEASVRHSKNLHFNHHTHSFFIGWIISQAAGFMAAFKLVGNIFKPVESSLTVSSSKHMDREGKMNIECSNPYHQVDGLQAGFTIHEMADRVEGLLRMIGLVREFAPLVYMIGHGASSTNNTHYAGYDCGACSGRAGSVNARAFAYMANHSQVRLLLKERGIDIPSTTYFVPALHDTTRDEIEFYDEKNMLPSHVASHQANKKKMEQALHANAKERSRRFLLVDTKKPKEEIHQSVRRRAFSLFEPRPEWNHATNALCIVGRRKLTKKVFLDRRAFLNSYDYETDPHGDILMGILKAVSPVCGGINLEYYFSRVDNHRFGAGTKLSHNVVGLIGVANGMGGDLRTGLPKQMINIHDPLRLMMIVEHKPEVVLDTLKKHPPTYEWYNNNWITLCVIHPETAEVFRFSGGEFSRYRPMTKSIQHSSDMNAIVESSHENLPVYILN